MQTGTIILWAILRSRQRACFNSGQKGKFFMNMQNSYLRMILSIVILTLLAACGESRKAKTERLKLIDEAYEVGVAIGLAERCGLEYAWSSGVPKQYDDSLKSGAIASAFQSGYAYTRSLSFPCLNNSRGRPPRR